MPTVLELAQLRLGTDRGMERLLEELSITEDLADMAPLLSGEQVMELLDLSPGPEVGAALAALRERRYVDGPTDSAGEVAFLKARLSSSGDEPVLD